MTDNIKNIYEKLREIESLLGEAITNQQNIPEKLRHLYAIIRNTILYLEFGEKLK